MWHGEAQRGPNLRLEPPEKPAAVRSRQNAPSSAAPDTGSANACIAHECTRDPKPAPQVVGGQARTTRAELRVVGADECGRRHERVAQHCGGRPPRWGRCAGGGSQPGRPPRPGPAADPEPTRRHGHRGDRRSHRLPLQASGRTRTNRPLPARRPGPRPRAMSARGGTARRGEDPRAASSSECGGRHAAPRSAHRRHRRESPPPPARPQSSWHRARAWQTASRSRAHGREHGAGRSRRAPDCPGSTPERGLWPPRSRGRREGCP